MDMEFGLLALLIAFGHLIVYAIRSAKNQARVAEALARISYLEDRYLELAEQSGEDHEKLVQLEIELNNIH